jgi:hypothetical protein
MSNDADAMRIAQKNKLIAEGGLYRARIVHARAQAGAALRPEALLHEAIGRVRNFANLRLDSWLAPTGLRWQSVMPLLLTALSFVGRRRLIKPALGVAIAAGALAWYARRRQ